MSISEAFDGVIPARPVSPAPRQTAPAKVVRIHPHHNTATRTAPRPSAVRRMARVVYLDANDSWIAEEQSPSAKTVWRTDHTGHLDKPWAVYRAWAYTYRPVAVVVALAFDGVKWLLIHPSRVLLTAAGAFAIYLIHLATN